MLVKIGCIVILITIIVFVGVLIWYIRKLRCLKYTGRASGTIISSTELKQSFTAPEKQKYYKIDIEYSVNGQKYKLHRSCSPLENSSLGCSCEVIYDENDPAKNILAKEIEDHKLAKNQWIAILVFAAGVVLAVFVAWMPILFDFNKKQYDVYKHLIYLIIFTGSVIAILRKLAKKEKRTVKDYISSTLLILFSLFLIAFISYFTFLT